MGDLGITGVLRPWKTPWALFAHFRAKCFYSWEIVFFSGKSVCRSLSLYRIPEKANEKISKKVGYGRTDGYTDGPTDKHEFMGPPFPEIQLIQHRKALHYAEIWLFYGTNEKN